MYGHAPENYVCPFCLIAQGVYNEHVLSRPSDIVCRTETVTAFVSSHQWPNNTGNVLIIPSQHFENIFTFPVELAVDIQRVARAVAFALKAVLLCDGVSTRQHNEPVGNQDVWHYHLHVTPRYQDDGFYSSQKAFMPAKQRADYATRIRVWLDAAQTQI